MGAKQSVILFAFPMHSENYLHLPSSIRSQFIYRIVSVERLFELFASKQNVLVKPDKWEDPFENFILKCRVRLPDGRYATIGFRDQFLRAMLDLAARVRRDVANLFATIGRRSYPFNNSESCCKPLAVLW